MLVTILRLCLISTCLNSLRKLRKQVLSIKRPKFESKVKEKWGKNNLTDLHDNSRRNHVKNPKEK